MLSARAMSTSYFNRRLPRPRDGYTLLELIAASTLIGAVVVTTLSLLRDGIELSRKSEVSIALLTLCVSVLEEHLALTAANFAEANETGDFSAMDHPQLRFRVIRSADPADGGIADRLMAVIVTVWHDVNGNGAQDAGEPSLTLASKVAKLANY